MQGHIHKRVHTTKAGKTTVRWYVVVEIGRDSNGRRRQKWHGSYRTRREAEQARAEIVGELHRGMYVAPTNVTLAGWVIDTWLDLVRAQLKASTWDSYRRNLDLHVLPAIGHLPLRDITSQVLNKLYARLLADGKRNAPGGLSAKTVRYVHTTLHKVLADAVDADLIARNPADRAKPPRPERIAAKELNCWHAGELKTFLDHVRETRWYAAWHLAAMTGMRRGEVLGLRWSDLHLERACISIRHTIVSVGYAVQESTPKTHQARVVDLDPETLEQLRAHRARQEAERAEWGAGYKDHGLVFCRENGTPIHPDSFSQRFELEVRHSGLRRIRIHDLRHTHATIALQAGVPVKVISERLGHESPAFTMKQYAHVLPGMQAEAAARIAEAIAASDTARASGDTQV
jgi:integrase